MGRPERDVPKSAGSEQLTGVHAALEAIRAGRRKLRVLRVRRGRPRPELAELLAAAREAGVPVESVEERELALLAPKGSNHQGVALEAEPLPELSLESLLGTLDREEVTLVALDGVEDPQNLGAIARVAEGAGVAGLIVPRRRSAPLSPAAIRASAGALEWLPCARVANLPRALNELKSKGFWIFGSAPDGSCGLFELPERALAGRRVAVFGAEGRGIRRGVDRVVDFRLRIPLEGRVASLNVAAAAAIVLFELKRRTKLASSARLPYK
ncbi:MAG TPA: 23S rRNA (guanosine(2251)-2'-O)-methyltransferase RlmB [Myxococcota bacterium]|nr:23S rRNA (guanosine(2251)-2'-O)-methyltransferase RlmB [Myxococcota bacterium]